VSDGVPAQGRVRPARLVTVCLGNICRSPTAEAALLEAAAGSGIALEVASAGTGDWHVGHAPDERMRAAAAAVGLELRGEAQQVDAALLAWADLVLVMDRTNLRDVERLAEAADLTTPITLFRTFDPELAPSERIEAEVPDPYYGGPEGFTDVVEICRRTARALVDALDAVVAHEGTGPAPTDRGGSR
jgi:protein-tyrosine phosphatase